MSRLVYGAYGTDNREYTLHHAAINGIDAYVIRANGAIVAIRYTVGCAYGYLSDHGAFKY